jgi:hypothetical protein
VAPELVVHTHVGRDARAAITRIGVARVRPDVNRANGLLAVGALLFVLPIPGTFLTGAAVLVAGGVDKLR